MFKKSLKANKSVIEFMSTSHLNEGHILLLSTNLSKPTYQSKIVLITFVQSFSNCKTNQTNLINF